MKRKLMKQVGSEWKSNVWLAVELLVVSVVLWYVSDFLYVQGAVVNMDMGIDTENCYLLSQDRISVTSADFEPSDTIDDVYRANKLKFYERIRNHEDVEEMALGLSGSCVPYTQNSWNVTLERSGGGDTVIIASPNMRQVTPEYVKVFRIKGGNGESPEELAKVLERGDCLISDRVALIDGWTQEKIDDFYRNGSKFELKDQVGKNFMCGSFSQSDSLKLGGIMAPIKRIEYETPEATVLIPIKPDDAWAIFVRVKPGHEDGFEERFMTDAEDQLRVGNNFIREVTPISTIRDVSQAEYNDEVRNHIVVMVFLMVMIFLGLLGTFWFRTQQRVSEIAIRMVNGATKGAILRRLMGEGLLLLVIVTPLAVFGDWLLCRYEMNVWFDGFYSHGRFAITCGAVFVLMAGMIVLGIAFPAMRAMRVNAAEALKDE